MIRVSLAYIFTYVEPLSCPFPIIYLKSVVNLQYQLATIQREANFYSDIKGLFLCIGIKFNIALNAFIMNVV